MKVLFFGTYDVRTHPRVLVLQEGLRAAGDTVAECNVPLGLDTAWRVRLLRQPWLLPVLAARLLGAWTRLAWRARLRAARAADAVVVGYLGHFDVLLARRLFPGKPVALDHLVSAADTAQDRGIGGAGRGSLLARLDAAAVAAADIPFVDTTEHLALLPAARRDRAVVVAVGAPEAWFRAPGPLEPDRLRVVFFGLFTPLQGAVTIGGALALLADEPRVHATMIGRGQDLAAAQGAAAGNPRVRWVSWTAADELPDVVAAHDVCLGIFGTGPKALRVVPNKVFQGAAAGCAVVTSDTPPQRGALGDAGVFVPPGDAAALAGALRRLAGDPALVRERRQAAGTLAERAFRPVHVVAPLRTALIDRKGQE